MAKGIIVTVQRFDDLNNKVHQWCLDNISGHNATKWADKLVHPTDGRIAFVIEDKILPALTDAEKNGIIELTNDWFPINEI